MEQVSHKDCETIRATCSRDRTLSLRWSIGIIVSTLLIVAVPLTGAAVVQRETNARQDERIKAVEANVQMIREDLREIKSLLNKIYELQGSGNDGRSR